MFGVQGAALLDVLLLTLMSLFGLSVSQTDICDGQRDRSGESSVTMLFTACRVSVFVN